MTGFMARDFFGASPLLILPVVALVLFAVAFIALAVRAVRMDRRDVQGRARLALEDGEQVDG